MRLRLGRWRYHSACTLFLAAHAALLAWSAWVHSPTIDEVGHFGGGVSHWQTGSFEAYRVNPPLVRMVATAMVGAWVPRIDPGLLTRYPGSRGEFAVGADLVGSLGHDASWLVTVARWACLPFSVIGGYFTFRWARDLSGPRVGLAALALWCLSPGVLAYGHLLLPDSAAAALGLAACYTFRAWLKEATWRRAYLAGLVLGLAELTKTTWITLYAVFPLLWMVWIGADACRGRAAGWCRGVLQLGAILLFSVLVVNLGYAGEGTLKPLGDFAFASSALGGREEVDTPEYANRFEGTWMGRLPVPLPENYLLGIDYQKWEFEHKYPSYLCGQWKPGGWWYYYLYAVAVKTPIAMGILALMAVGLSVVSRHSRVPWRDQLVLLLPGVTVFALVSSQTGFSHHLRYALPALPFFLVWISQSARAFSGRSSIVKHLVALSVAWFVASSLWVYPHSMGYFNELVGGPLRGHEHLLDSNVEWGQDLAYLKRWCDAHPEARPLYVLTYTFPDPKYLGIPSAGLPPSCAPEPSGRLAAKQDASLGPQPGWYAIGVTFLHGDDHPQRGTIGLAWVPYCGCFRRLRPVATAGYSVYIYHVTPEEANQRRRDSR